MTETLDRDELRKLFLFESLSDEQLDWLTEHGEVRTVPAGETVVAEGDPPTCFFVLLSGTLALSRLAGGERVLINRTDHVGSYFGATQSYLNTDRAQPTYGATVEAVTDMRIFQLPADEWGQAGAQLVPDGDPPARRHLPRHAEQPAAGQRAGAAARARVAVGRAHPRAQQPGRGRGPGHRRAAGADRRDAAQAGHARRRRDRPVALPGLVKLQEEAVERLAKAPKLGPIEASDAEDELGDWLDEQGVSNGWDLAPTLVAGGIDAAWLARAMAKCPGTATDSAVRWLAYTVETEMLMNEIEDATTRVSTLVGAAKQYSQMDRAPFQVIDVHELLNSTLVMLARKIGDKIKIVKAVRPVAAAAAGVCGRAQPGLDQPHRQRRAGDGWGGDADDPDLPRGRLRGDRDRRHRSRRAGRDRRADLRAVLHHQARRRGDRARAGHLLADRGQEAPR
jgi:hypothetical protein